MKIDQRELKVLQALGLVETEKNEVVEAKVHANEIADLKKEEVAEVETNANEVMHTANTGYGKELVPVNVLSEEIIDMIPKYSTFLDQLPGFHGTNMPASLKVPVIGEVDFFQGNSEPTTGALTESQATHRLATGEVTISQGSFIASISVSKRELNYAVGDLEKILKEKLAASAARTIEALILNADSEAGSTGNVNLDDAAPTSTVYYLQQDHGIRELAINGAALTVDCGTLDYTDFFDIMAKVGEFAADPSQCMWLTNRATYLKAMGLSDFVDASKRGENSTLSGKAITNIGGSDMFVVRDVPKTEADGKVSTTASNNTKGQILYAYKPAIQYGYGQPLEIDVQKVPGKGVNVVATFEFGFAIAQLLAGQTDSSVALGRNITL